MCIGFIANEALSIVENAGLMGVPLPGSLKRAVDVLQNKSMNLNGNCERKEVRENE